MSFGIVVAAVGTVAAGYMAANAAEDAANTAANAQKDSADASINESRRQFNEIQKILQPYVNAGTQGLAGQSDILGLNGQAAQGKSIDAIANSQQMQALTQQGENAMRQNAAATGGLRGGNFQGALANYRPALLNQLVQQQYANLGGLTSIGQNAAAGVGNAGMQSSSQIINALQQQGDASANAAIASGNAQAGLWSNIGGTINRFAPQVGGKF